MDDVSTYSKVFWSANTKSLAKFTALLAIIFALFLLIDAPGLIIILGVAFTLFMLIRIWSATTNPQSIILTGESIKLDSVEIPWSRIREVKFDRLIYRPVSFLGWEGAGILDLLVPNQVIIITTVDYVKTKIYPRLYGDNKQLRKEIEDMLHQRSIQTIVRDRGTLL